MTLGSESIVTAFDSPARAYAADLERIGDRVTLASASQDAEWVLGATRLHHARMLGAVTGGRQAKALARSLRPLGRGAVVADSILEGAEGAEPTFRLLIAWAERVEVAGGYALALNILASGAVLFGRGSPRGFSLSLAQRGRILRTLGAHDAAVDAYNFAIRESRRARFPIAAGRAAIGLAVTAQQRGDLERAGRAYATARRQAGTNRTLVSQSELGLCTVALTQGRIGVAVRHAMQALRARPSSQERKAEVLFNLAQACLRTGAPELAMSAAQQIVSLPIQPRTRLLGAGLGAVAAARLADRKGLAAMAALVRRDANPDILPYQTAGAWMLVCRARQSLGEGQAARQALLRARRVATAHGFGGLEADADRMTLDLSAEQTLSAGERDRIQATLAAV